MRARVLQNSTMVEQPAAALIGALENLHPGTALDLACGTGRHAIYLGKRGWRVVAVDWSPSAIATLRERARGLEIETRVVDLEAGNFAIDSRRYDLIVAWLYLQRDLFPKIRDGICAGGIAACSVLLRGRFAAQPGELQEAFDGWTVLHYEENGKAAELVAKKPL
ncbi:MAG: class I SAM-dependent methyltransferase [Bryobacteraceae bacterium]